MEALWSLVDSISAQFSWLLDLCPVQFLPSAATQIIEVAGSKYRVVKQLGEGGYAFVYLAKPVPATGTASAGAEPVAVKKILAGTKEKLSEAKREIEVLQSLSHINCLPLLGHAINASTSAAAGRAFEVLLVFPVYQDGTLLDELDRLAVDGRKLSSRQVLEIFRQICAGVGHMHSRGYAHMDLKPHNVLIRRPRSQQQHQPGPVSVPRSASRPRIRAAAAADSDDGGDTEAGTSLVSRGYHAVVMDFGSARAMPIHVSSRAQALAVQEDAEAHCTATFRAPELFDVPSHCTLTTQVDVWALGCTLFAMMYGTSPFQQALDQGASLALAVMNCHVPWPTKPGALRYPEVLHNLVSFCLSVDPDRRPSVSRVLEQVDDLLSRPDALPDPWVLSSGSSLPDDARLA